MEPTPDLPEIALQCMRRMDEMVFFSDFDGTLVHFAPHPDHVIVPTSLRDQFNLIAAKNHAFAIVTGRSLYRLDLLTQGASTMAIGSHGAEWRADPQADIEHLATPLSLPLRRAVEEVSDRHGCIFDDKLYTLSLHLPFDQMHKDLEPELRLALADTARLYTIQKAGRTVEILQQAINKGSGIRHVMRQPAFRGRKPFYIGDDSDTDPSLSVVTELGGVRLGVSSPSAQHPHHDSAVMDIDGARLLIDMLAQS